MKKRHWGTQVLAGLLILSLVSCGGGGGSSSQAGSIPQPPEEPDISAIAPVEPDPEPVYPYANPLTGEGLNEDVSGKRPVAVMFKDRKSVV